MCLAMASTCPVAPAGSTALVTLQPWDLQLGPAHARQTNKSSPTVSMFTLPPPCLGLPTTSIRPWKPLRFRLACDGLTAPHSVCLQTSKLNKLGGAAYRCPRVAALRARAGAGDDAKRGVGWGAACRRCAAVVARAEK